MKGSKLLPIEWTCEPDLSSALSLRAVALHNGEHIKEVDAVQRLCDGGKVVSWQTRRNG
jgi:hypothetical protein